jgi:hypothetical protein
VSNLSSPLIDYLISKRGKIDKDCDLTYNCLAKPVIVLSKYPNELQVSNEKSDLVMLVWCLVYEEVMYY